MLSARLWAASKVVRYSRTARASSAFRQLIGRSPGVGFFLFTSALIRPASIENLSPPTRQALRHDVLKYANASLRRKRSCRARLNAEWGSLPRYRACKTNDMPDYLHLSAQRPLRADRKHVAQYQHPDHQRRIDRRPTGARVVGRKLLVHPTKIENTVDLPDQMICRHHLSRLNA